MKGSRLLHIVNLLLACSILACGLTTSMLGTCATSVIGVRQASYSLRAFERPQPRGQCARGRFALHRSGELSQRPSWSPLRRPVHQRDPRPTSNAAPRKAALSGSERSITPKATPNSGVRNENIAGLPAR